MQINEPMRELDLGQAVVFLEKAVGEKGADYVYEKVTTDDHRHPGWGISCLYFHKGAPSCLVGHVLSYMGYDTEMVLEQEDAEVVFDDLGIKADTDTIDLLSTAQQLQDQGVPWGRAVETARGLDDD